MANVCKSEGCNKPVHCIELCQPHYRQERRRQRGLSKPGPKPDPTKKRSRYRDRDLCPEGHALVDDNVKVDFRNHRICVTCADAARVTHCPKRHEYTDENTYVDPNGGRVCRTCKRERMKERRPVTKGQGGHNAAKTHCPHGHEYTPENTYWWKNRRTCRECANVRSKLQGLRKYSMTPDHYMNLLELQDYRCAGCGFDFSEDQSGRCIDHDHSCCDGNYSCGKCVRGILCNGCNVALGSVREQESTLLALVAYLRNPPAAK